jgi:hypothetical protein
LLLQQTQGFKTNFRTFSKKIDLQKIKDSSSNEIPIDREQISESMDLNDFQDDNHSSNQTKKSESENFGESVGDWLHKKERSNDRREVVEMEESDDRLDSQQYSKTNVNDIPCNG